MHYGDNYQLAHCHLSVVVYKHSTSGKVRRNRDGLLSRNSVGYELTSIHECSLFPPKLLSMILADPHKYFADHLDPFEFERWYLLDVWQDVSQLSVKVRDVTEDEEKYRLH